MSQIKVELIHDYYGHYGFEITFDGDENNEFQARLRTSTLTRPEAIDSLLSNLREMLEDLPAKDRSSS